jgi:CRP-like cAMP-binding protein
MKPEDIERHFDAGQCIVERGAEGRELFVISSGNVLLSQRDGDVPRLLCEGEIFGEAAAILGQPYEFRAEAHGEVELLAIDPPLLDQLCRENVEFSFRLVQHLAGQLGSERGRASRDRGAAADARHAASRRVFAEAVHSRQLSGEPPVVIKGHLRDLSDEADMSMLEAYHCLHELIDDRVLRLVDDQLTLLDPEELERLRNP